jgi:uncharacterized membrane protein YkvA (DUF1232 family)
MSQEKQPMPVEEDRIGLLASIVRRLALVWRLFTDERVSWGVKMIPVLTALYVLSPVDLMPEMVAGPVGGIDDLAAVLLGLNLFIELSPPEIVREHLRQLGAQAGGWQVTDEQADQGDVVEGEARLIDE